MQNFWLTFNHIYNHLADGFWSDL